MKALYKVDILDKPRTVQTPIQSQHHTSWQPFPRTDHPPVTGSLDFSIFVVSSSVGVSISSNRISSVSINV